MFKFFFNIFISVILCCCSQKESGILTTGLNHTDYIEKIDVSGTIQAVNIASIVVPRVPASSMVVADIVQEGTYVHKGDTVCILRSSDIEVLKEAFLTDLEKMEADLNKLEANNNMEIAMLNAQIATNKFQLAITMLDSLQMKYAPSVKKKLMELEMKKAIIEKNKLQKKLVAQKRINTSEVMQLRSRIAMQKSRIGTTMSQIKSLRLAAPRDGILMYYENPVYSFAMSSNTGFSIGTFGGKIQKGSAVRSGFTIVQIPDMNEMQVTVDVLEADFKRIKENQFVTIDVDAVKALSTTGKVKRKILGSNSPKFNQQTSSVKTYQVILTVDSCHLRMVPGLSAKCSIIIEQVRDTVVVPAEAIYIRDSAKIVYVAFGKKFRTVHVETGLSNGTFSIISKGLKGDETIALIEPGHKFITEANEMKSDTTLKAGLVEKVSVFNKVFKILN